MARIAAMAKKDGCSSSSGVVMKMALFAAALIALAGMEAAGEAIAVDANVAMLTGACATNSKGENKSRKDETGHSISREVQGGGRRQLATAMVWCVAKANMSEAMLQGALDWVCGPMPAQGQVNCGPVQSGQSCFLPDTLLSHASWAFNVYFQNHNASNEACDFQGTADQVYTDPSTSTCIFLGSSKEVNGTISNGTFTPAPPGFLPTSAAAGSLIPLQVMLFNAAVAMFTTRLFT